MKHAVARYDLPAYDHDNGRLHAIIETVQGSRHKVKFDADKGIFRVKSVLPAGASFPFDFGFVPSTLGEDGDPLDVMVLMDAPTFPGCLVEARLLGVIEASQRDQEGGRVRNDRLLAVAAESSRYRGVHSIGDMPASLLDEIEDFFINYNRAAGKRFTPLRRRGPHAAHRLVKQGMKQFRRRD